MQELGGKTAVVTGGASGIGRGIGLALAAKDVSVVVADIELATAQATAEEIAAAGVAAVGRSCDVADSASVEELADFAFSRFGHVDLLFNNAGVSIGGLLIDSTPEDLQWLFSVNVYGCWNGCSVFGRRFRDQGTPAHICNTGSEHSLGRPHLRAGVYTASKHAVLGLSDVLRCELPSFIGVSVLCPGVVRSELWNAARNRPRGGQDRSNIDAGAGNTTTNADDAFARAVMERGRDPLEIGKLAVEGVQRGDFYIPTHPHSRLYVENRYREMLAAFDGLGPLTEADKRFDVTAIVAELLEHREGSR